MARALLGVSVDDQLSWTASVPGRLPARIRSAIASGAATNDDGPTHPLMRVLRDEAPTTRPEFSVSPPPAMSIRLFGAFEIVIGGVPLSLLDLRPRARSVLRYLALHVGSPVHRESIMEAMWPDTDPVTAGKRLHVAISAIRHQLDSAGPSLIRTAESYQLGGPAWPISTDLETFDRAVQDLARAAGSDTSGNREAAAQLVLSLYAGELLLEEGPATWAVREREDRQHAYLAAIRYLATVRAAQSDWNGTVSLCRQGLRIDRYQDELWRTLLSALTSAGRTVDLERARLDYDALLLEMSIPASGETSSERRTRRLDPLLS